MGGAGGKREILIPIAQIKNKIEQQSLLTNAAPSTQNMVHFALVTRGKNNKA